MANDPARMSSTIPAQRMTTFKKTMRWIAVLPAAFLAVVVVWFPVHWAVMFFQHYNNPDYWPFTVDDKSPLALISADTLERFGDAFFPPFAFVFVGAHVAPLHKFMTGIFLAILYLTGTIVLSTVVAPHYGIHITDGPLRIVALALTGIAGISCGLFQARKADQNAFINAL
jgi:hypothetical protein